MRALTRDEARRRTQRLSVHSYEVHLDLTRGETSFGSRTVLRFGCRRPGWATFLDLRPLRLVSVVLNGAALDATTLVDGRLPLPGLEGENELEVVANMAFRDDGQGLHRTVDPEDGLVYVYGHLFLDAAPSVFGCFDQPDLKAPYDVSVTAPPGWVVLGNGAATQVAPGQWRLARTPPLATYFVTVCAGRYVSIRDEHEGIPLSLHSRASVGPALARNAADVLAVTRGALSYYEELFGLPYAFGDYAQVFVPEFNPGAMENPGCVVLRDELLYRGRTTDDQLLQRARTIAHEAAHMWFGDLVTLRWWDDLWLNESFAEYLSHRTLVALSGTADAWTDFLVTRKVWGYAIERTAATHPVVGDPGLDAQSALQEFDGISYAKGAAVLRQLIAYVGDDAFVAGVRTLLREHAFGAVTLADFLAAMERAGGRELDGWTAAWLRTAGLDAVEVRAPLAPDGRYADAWLVRELPQAGPQRGSQTRAQTRMQTRPHHLDVAGFTAGREDFRVEVDVTEAETALPGLAGRVRSALLVPNAADLTWVTVRLDAGTLAALPAELAQVRDDQARGVVWVSLVDGVALGRVDPRLLLDVFCAAWPFESSASVQARIAEGMVTRLIPAFLPPAEQPAAWRRLVEAADRARAMSEPTSAAAVIAARLVARWGEDVAKLSQWMDGVGRPEGLDGDQDFGWQVVRNLAWRGVLGVADISAAERRDPSFTGRLAALTAFAARPDTSAKEWAWRELAGPGERSNAERVALAAGFWDPMHSSLTAAFVERYFAEMPHLSGRLGEDALGRLAAVAFPSTAVSERTLELAETSLGGGGLSPAVRRAMASGAAMLAEALTSRRRFEPG